MKEDTTRIRQEAPATIRSMFDSIAPTYDLLNHLLSFGMDIRWRKKAIRFCEGKKNGTFLDIAAGSGDLSLALLALAPKQIVATDFAVRMLEVFRGKIGRRTDAGAISLASCDAHRLPFRDASFDGTFVAFGIRNFADRPRALREMLRVLKPGGRSVILELTKPESPVAAQLYGIHSGVVLPLLGALISRHNDAYRYLPQSIAAFPTNGEFCRMMSQAGFLDVEAHPLTFGAATIFTGVRTSAAG